MMAIAKQCGLRRGELLKVRIDDLPKPGYPGLKVRRRPHDPSDRRRHRPAVKTVERVLELSGEVEAGLRAYLTGSKPGRRRAGRTPYLFVTAGGDPMSIGAADDLIRVVAARTGIPDLSWHTFRHTWAEAIAKELLRNRPEEEAFALLRELGGWKPGSQTPAHYIQDALADQANAHLRHRNSMLYPLKGETKCDR